MRKPNMFSHRPSFQSINLFWFNLTRNCDRLDVLVFKVPISQRPNAKMRVDQLKYDIRHLQSALQNWQQKKQKRDMEIRDREQLLNRRFTSNSETTIDLDYSLQQHNSMNNAHQGVDEMIMTGSFEFTSCDAIIKLPNCRTKRSWQSSISARHPERCT